MDRRSAVHGGMLALAAFIWGTAFVAQSLGMEHIGPCAFNAARSFVGCIVLLPVIAAGRKLRAAGRGQGGEVPLQGFGDERPDYVRSAPKVLWSGGAACGILLAGASLLQQASLQYTTAGKAGFLTSLYIVIVPVLGIFLGRKAGGKVWAAVALALVGAYLLSVSGGDEGFAMGMGEILVLLCSVIFSLHIMVIDRVAPKVDGVQLSCIQFLVAGIVSAIAALCLERDSFTMGGLLASWGPLLYVGVLSSGVAYTLQIVGQKGLNPAVASLIMSLESVFAAISGWLVLNQPLSPREMAGCALVFGGVILAQLPGRKRAGEEK